MEEGKVKIDKFDGKNFGFWKMQMKDYLYQRDLYLPLGGKKDKPKDMNDKKWEVLDRKALGAIILTLSSSVAFNISKEKTTKDVMAALMRMYAKPSASNKVFLMRRLLNVQKTEGKSMIENLNDFNAITSQLESVGLTFENEMLAVLILSSLPDSWDSLVMTVNNSSGSNPLNFEDVVGVLLSEDTRRKNNSIDVSSAGALSVGESGRSSKRGTKERKEKGDKESVNLTMRDESSDDDLVLTYDMRCYSWVLDSCVSFLATSNRQSFLSYEKGNFDKVYLGDDKPCEIVGRGDVHICLADGSTLKLKQVRHVPKVARNLVSVSQLSDEWCITMFGSDSWKVSKGSMIMAKGKR
ncbi:hypothetical protein KSP39_PZI021448 [Platanthera zijinensis]|uniref:Retrovirus-related Pol polyprotein from transposon TNT 1-94-like beta-barrel domain-containing protein n=1 Tax=Platanthera zijinensis TaxID=2320716 RepID=A0AAP0FWG8_9ASPA